MAILRERLPSLVVGLVLAGRDEPESHVGRAPIAGRWRRQGIVPQKPHEQDRHVVNQRRIDDAQPGMEGVLREPTEETLDIGWFMRGKHHSLAQWWCGSYRCYAPL